MKSSPSMPIPPAHQHNDRAKPADQAEQRKRCARQKKIDGMVRLGAFPAFDGATWTQTCALHTALCMLS